MKEKESMATVCLKFACHKISKVMNLFKRRPWTSFEKSFSVSHRLFFFIFWSVLIYEFAFSGRILGVVLNQRGGRGRGKRGTYGLRKPETYFIRLNHKTDHPMQVARCWRFSITFPLFRRFHHFLSCYLPTPFISLPQNTEDEFVMKCLFSMKYWFRVMDLDEDGCISLHEMEQFFDGIVEKMTAANIDAMCFNVVCLVLFASWVADCFHFVAKRRSLGSLVTFKESRERVAVLWVRENGLRSHFYPRLHSVPPSQRICVVIGRESLLHKNFCSPLQELHSQWWKKRYFVGGNLLQSALFLPIIYLL